MAGWAARRARAGFLGGAPARFAEALGVGLVRGAFGLLRALGVERASALGGWLGRTIGPRLPVHRVALGNLRLAYPERDDAWHRATAREAWDNLGRTGAEYAHLGALFDYRPDGPPGRCEVAGIEHFLSLRDDGRPGLLISAHLGNWELPAICAAAFGMEATAVFRPPNNPAVARIIAEVRGGAMGGLAAAGPGAAFAAAAVVARGGHLGQLVDQHFTRGVVTPFFGRPALTNPLIAKLAREHDCPVHGVRVVRLPGARFRLELTPPLDLPRDAAGRVDVAGACAVMAATVEGWVREHPGQWLWMHRRWRAPPAPPR